MHVAAVLFVVFIFIRLLLGKSSTGNCWHHGVPCLFSTKCGCAPLDFRSTRCWTTADTANKANQQRCWAKHWESNGKARINLERWKCLNLGHNEMKHDKTMETAREQANGSWAPRRTAQDPTYSIPTNCAWPQRRSYCCGLETNTVTSTLVP